MKKNPSRQRLIKMALSDPKIGKIVFAGSGLKSQSTSIRRVPRRRANNRKRVIRRAAEVFYQIRWKKL